VRVCGRGIVDLHLFNEAQVALENLELLLATVASEGCLPFGIFRPVVTGGHGAISVRIQADCAFTVLIITGEMDVD
jgi:hypothetical protein